MHQITIGLRKNIDYLYIRKKRQTTKNVLLKSLMAGLMSLPGGIGN